MDRVEKSLKVDAAPVALGFDRSLTVAAPIGVVAAPIGVVAASIGVVAVGRREGDRSLTVAAPIGASAARLDVGGFDWGDPSRAVQQVSVWM